MTYWHCIHNNNEKYYSKETRKYLSYLFRLRMNMKKTGVKRRIRKINLRFVWKFLCLFFTDYWFFINQLGYQPNLIFSYHRFKNIKFFQEMALEPHLQEINSTKSVEDRWLLYLCTLCIYVLYVSLSSMYLVLYVSMYSGYPRWWTWRCRGSD